MYRKARAWKLKLLVIGLVWMLAVSSFVGLFSASDEEKQDSLTPHAPIYISGNSGFTSTNGVVSGSGTASDPYIIENWDINASSANGIEIRNTDVYFTIRNCVIQDGKSNYKYGTYFYNATNGRIDSVTFYNNYCGLWLYYSSNNIITNCNINDNSYYNGIYLGSSSGNQITNCTIRNNNQWGIYLDSSSSNQITNCSIYNNAYDGIWLGNSPNNTITNCDVYNNSHNGIYLHSSSHNIIMGCTIYSNSYNGIYLDSFSNSIYHNNFINNTNQSYDVSANTWDNGYPSGGNYWGDYTGVDLYSGSGQNISGSDGVGDNPYNIPGGSNQDRYPLMSQSSWENQPDLTLTSSDISFSNSAPNVDDTIMINVTVHNTGGNINQTSVNWEVKTEMNDSEFNPSTGGLTGWTLTETYTKNCANVSNSILTLNCTGENKEWYYERTDNNLSNSVGATLEVREKVISADNSSTPPTAHNIRDGAYLFSFGFTTKRVSLNGQSSFEMNTTDTYHTYRMVTKGYISELYVDGILRLTSVTPTAVITDKKVAFGDTTENPGFDFVTKIDYVYYTTKGAFAPGDVGVSFYDGNPAANGTLIGTSTISSISAGSSALASVNWTPTTAGTHIIYVVVDPDNLITESDETNNEAYKNIYVSGAGLPDLTLSSSDISFSNSNPVVDDTIKINATVWNVGGNITSTNQTFYDGFENGTLNNWVTNTSGNASISIVSSPVYNGSKACKFEGSGSSYECCMEKVFSSKIIAKTAKFSWAMRRDTTLAGEMGFQVWDDNNNPVFGINSRTGDYLIHWQISPGGWEDDIGLQYGELGTWYYIEVVADFGTQRGNVWINGVLKGENLPFTLYNSNYGWYSTDNFRKISALIGYNSCVGYLDDVKVEYTTTANVTVKFYDGNPSTNGTLIGTSTISSIPAGSSATASVNWTPTTAGTHIIYVVVDPDNLITESDETNNIAWKSITVQGVANQLPVVNITYPADGQTVNGTVTITGTAYDPDNNSGLVAYWNFNENGGTTAYDSSGNNNNGTIYNATWTDGVSSSALSFDGVNDYVDVGKMWSFGSTLGGDKTYELWLKTTSTAKTILFGTYNDGFNTQIQLEVNTDEYGPALGKIAFDLRDDGHSDQKHLQFYTPTAYNFYDGNWHHLVVITKPSTNTAEVYWDSEKQSITYTYQNVLGPFSDFQYTMVLGAVNIRGAVARYFNGTIDEVRIYNKALSASEIQSHYEEYTGLVASWHFDENTGTIVYDSSGNNNNGTIYGATWTTGVSGSALSFDGVNDYVDVGTMGNFGSTLDGNKTYELWFKTTSTAKRALLGTYNNGFNTQVLLEVNTGAYSQIPGKIGFDLRDDGHSDQKHLQFYTPTAYNFYDGNWHHLVVITKPSTNTAEIYLDGQTQNITYTYQNILGPFSNFQYTMVLGAMNVRGLIDGYLNGTIDEVRIYNRALSASEIQAHYGGSSAGVEKVEIKIDSGSWQLATGTTSWSFIWNTTTVSNGWHTIYARAYDGIDYSEIKAVNVYVNNLVDNEPPVISNVQANPQIQVPNGWVNITCTVTDNVAVNEVVININSPGGFFTAVMTKIAGTNNYYYNNTYSTLGTYNYTIWANDTSGNFALSTGYQFEIVALLPTVDYIQIRDSPNGGGNIVGDMTYYIGENDTYWCAAYNYTWSYISDVSAEWWCSNTSVGAVTTTGSSTAFTALGQGTCYVMVSYYSAKIMPGITNTTGTITVLALNQPPVANFTYSPPYPSTIVAIQFNDTSTDLDGYIALWFWDFGDGITSTVQNPIHQYGEPGNYSVTLTVWDDDGANDTVTRLVTVEKLGGTLSGYVRENITFNPIQGALVNVSFHNTYRNAYTNETGYYYIDDISICNCSKNVTVSKEGYLTKTEWVGIAEQTWLNFTLDPVSVNQPPTAVTLYEPVDITTSSMTLAWSENTDMDFAKYEIYESGAPGILGSLIETITTRTITTFVRVGLSPDTTYYFTVRVVDTGGLYNDSNQVSGKTPKENQQPSAYIDSISPNPANQGETVTFTGHGTDADGSIVAYSWGSSIDGFLSDLASFDTSTLSVGTHTISFKVKDNNGAWSSEATATLVIQALNQLPTADFTYSPTAPTTSDTITFTDTSTDSDGTISSWDWEFGDGSSSTLQNPTHQYTAAGTYTVRLTVTDNGGANSTCTEDITVKGLTPNQQPVVTITYPSDSSVVWGLITITGTANDADGTVQKVEVKIGDGSWESATGTAAWTYIWDTALYAGANHTVSVRAYDGTDYSVVKSAIVYVDIMPVASFTYYQGIQAINGEYINVTLRVAGEKYKIVNLTVYENGNKVGFVSVERVPGKPEENTTSILIDSSKLYTILLEYTAEKKGGNSVWVTVGYGDISNETHYVFHDDETKELDLTHTINEMLWATGFAKFDASSSYDSDGEIVDYSWNFGDGAYGYGMTAEHNYAPGNHTVSLTVRDDNSATNTTSKYITSVDLTGYCAAYRDKYYGVSLHCLADLTITDLTGAIIGYNSTSGKHENWLPNATMILSGEFEIYLIPKGPGDFGPGDFIYLYKVSGRGGGDFSFLVFDPGDFEPGDFGPGDFGPGDFSGRVYQINSAVTSGSSDEIKITADGDNISIKADTDKFYSLYITNGSQTFTVRDVPLNKNSTHTLSVLNWSALSEIDIASVNLTIDEFSDGIVDRIEELWNNFNIADKFKPDLNVTLTLSNYDPKADENVSVYVTLRNTGEGPARNIKIRFLVDNAPYGEDYEIALLWRDGAEEITFYWTAKEGVHKLSVRVDPEYAIAELNENNNEASINIEVKSAGAVPIAPLASQAVAIVGGVAAVSIVVAAALAGTEVGKYGFFSLFGPLFVKRKTAVLDQFTRGRIYEHIKLNPGAHYNSIRDSLELGNGTLSYHLTILEKEGYIKSETEGMYKRFYSAGRANFFEKAHLPLSDLQQDIVDLVRSSPGITQKEITVLTNKAHQVISYNIKVLTRLGVINERKEGLKKKLYLEEKYAE